METVRKAKAVVFVGPPLSGKSTLARAYASANQIAYLSMDELRVRFFPNSDNRREHRQGAYSQMHEKAERLLGSGNTVVLDATYTPYVHRQALRQVLDSTNAVAYIVECQIDPEIASKRFCEREEGHPAADMTAQSVHEAAIDYPYSGNPGRDNEAGTLVINGSFPNTEIMQKFPPSQKPTKLDVWVKLPVPPSYLAGERHEGQRLTTDTVQRAKWAMGSHLFLLILSGLTAAASLFIGIWGVVQKNDHYLSIAQLSAALAIVAGGLIPLWNFWKDKEQELKARRDAGKVPVFCSGDQRPADAFLFQQYQARVTDACKGLSDCWIDDVPVFYLIPPRKGTLFNIAPRKRPDDFGLKVYPALVQEAAKFGLDWESFVAWRLNQIQRDYPQNLFGRYAFKNHIGIRVVSKPIKSNYTYELEIARCTYLDYRCTDASVNISPVPKLGSLRCLFEGDDWKNRTIDLTNVTKTAQRFSMLIGVSVLLTVMDNLDKSKRYLVLTRRSSYISEGAGNIAPTAAGSTNWQSDFEECREGDPIKSAALRELWEEVGISRDDLCKPDEPCFMAAAFNLLHGRDLSFYAYFETNLKVNELWQRVKRAKDKWEIQHLILIPVADVTADGTFKEHFFSLECNRHLRAALKAFATSIGHESDIK